MIASAPRPGTAAPNGGRPEPLENGDRLAAPEFLRRYEAMPHIKKAELIEGVVYMASPIRMGAHAEPESLMQGWLVVYAAHTPGTSAGANGTVQLDMDNVPQPDAMLRILSEYSGQSFVDDEDYLVGAPELVVEISASSVSIDLRDKLNAYRRNGVKEYLTWRTMDAQLDWRILKDGKYLMQEADTKGIIRSTVFPGLWLSRKALLARNGAAMLSTLQAGLKSAEHRAFVNKLAAHRRHSKGGNRPE